MADGKDGEEGGGGGEAGYGAGLFAEGGGDGDESG